MLKLFAEAGRCVSFFAANQRELHFLAVAPRSQS
jgi:hypothetical protein